MSRAPQRKTYGVLTRKPPKLPEEALAAYRLGGMTAAAAIGVSVGSYECPGCDGSGVGDEATGRITSVGGRQCGACHGAGYLAKRQGGALSKPW